MKKKLTLHNTSINLPPFLFLIKKPKIMKISVFQIISTYSSNRQKLNL